MTVAECIRSWGSLLIVLLAGSVVWTSCDLASAGNTAILNADASIPPIVRHRFEYTKDDVVGEKQVAVSSNRQSSGLDAVLDRNGFSRSDVVDARVDSVQVERLQAPSLREATVFLGTSAEAPRIARIEFQPNGASSAVDKTRRTVTGAVRNGAEMLFGQFSVEDLSNIPSSGGMVRATVYYRIEVEGV